MTRSFRIEALRRSELEPLHQLLVQKDVAESLGISCDQPLSETSARWLEAPNQQTLVLVARSQDGALCGAAGLETRLGVRTRHRGSIWVAVSAAHRQNGIGFALLRELTDQAFLWRGLLRLEADIPTRDPVAKRLARASNWQGNVVRRGALATLSGAFVDLTRYELLRHPLVPAGPRPISREPANLGAALVRPLKSTDAADMARVYGDPVVCWGTLQLPFATEVGWEARVNTPSVHSFVAEIAGRVVGSAGLFVHAEPRFSHVGYFGMGLLPEAHGRGLGYQLVLAIIQRAKELKLRRVELEVYVDNPWAERLYRKCGFVDEGVSVGDAFRLGGYADSRWMGLELAQSLT